jgi:uncharacterized membrane protein (DUF4010 family)
MEDGHPHPGITMHRLKVRGDPAGLIFTAGIVLIFLLGIPASWDYLGLAIVGGTVVALILRKRKALKVITIAGADNRPL